MPLPFVQTQDTCTSFTWYAYRALNSSPINADVIIGRTTVSTTHYALQTLPYRIKRSCLRIPRHLRKTGKTSRRSISGSRTAHGPRESLSKLHFYTSPFRFPNPHARRHRADTALKEFELCLSARSLLDPVHCAAIGWWRYAVGVDVHSRLPK